MKEEDTRMPFAPLSGPFGQWLKRHREAILDMTQESFGESVVCSIGSIQSYEQGRMFPSKDTARRIALFINYPDIEDFVRFARQDARDVRSIRPRAKPKKPEPNLTNLASPIEAESWPIFIEERFKNNDNRWGLGLKDDGTGFVQRSMIDGSYVLTLVPKHLGGCFLSGDSAIFAPETFYLTVEVEKVEGPFDGTGGIFFEALHDQQHVLFHLRNDEQEFAVADIKGGGKYVTRIVPWQHRPDVIRMHGMNKFGLLGRGDVFTFFINDVELATARVARTPGARLDLAIGGVTLHQRVICLYRNFILRVPPGA